jgi:hypothetical protein
MSSQFAVGIKLKGKTDHVFVEAEDALVAALKVKIERPDAAIMYVRRTNKRGDARHLRHTLEKAVRRRES